MSDKPTPCIHGRNFCLECHCVKHDKANCQTCTEWYAEAPKPRCHIFGCTIPRGIPHEHPAGVSAVMRDPVAPLNADERAELERYRASAENDLDEDAKRLREALIHQARGMQCASPGSPLYDRAMGTNYYVVPADGPMVPGIKLRDSLMMAGKPRRAADFHGVNIVEDLPRSSLGMPGWDRPQRLKLVQIIGRIALSVGVASILILSAMTAGWL